MGNEFYNGAADLLVRQNIIVTDDVTAVELTLWVNSLDYYTATGVSRRDPSDPVDREIGVKLAAGRAFRKLGRELLKEGHMLVTEHDHAVKTQQEAAEAAKQKKAQRTKEIRKGLKKDGVSI